MQSVLEDEAQELRHRLEEWRNQGENESDQDIQQHLQILTHQNKEYRTRLVSLSLSQREVPMFSGPMTKLVRRKKYCVMP